MKKILICLVLISLSLCQPSPEKIEEIKKRRKEEMKLLGECLLKSEKASEKIKTAIKESPEDDVMRAIHHSRDELDNNDRDAIRECRRQAFEASHEKFMKDDILKRHEKSQRRVEL